MQALARCFIVLALVAAAMGSSGAGAQPVGPPGPGSGPPTPIAGSFQVKYPDTGGFSGTFSCLGAPKCVGIYTMHDDLPGCANSYVHTETFTLDGIDLSANGPISATMTLSGLGQVASVGPGQVCTFNDGGGSFLIPIRGTYNAGSATFTSRLAPDPADWLYGSFTTNVSGSPLFPMDVFGDLRISVVSGAVSIKPRPQDVGVPEKIYVFAHAPAVLVRGAGASKRAGSDPPVAAVAEDGAVVCVLAQVDASGHLVAVSASSMQEFLSGAISAQGQAVDLLNAVPTTLVGGSMIFVGYGPNAASMLANGLYQAALSVPGPVQCTSSLAAAPAPKTAGPLTGLWWNESEPGWGIHFTQRSNIIVATWYTYDAAGNPKWYIASNCVGPSGTSGTCTGAVYEVNGPKFFGTNFTPITGSQVTQSGNLAIAFADANNATMSFTVAGVTRTVAIKRQVFPIAPTAPPAIDYTDLWWNPNEAGWGMAITQQYGNIFLAWYVYDSAGKPFWYVASNCTVSGSSCSGTLYRTTSAPFAATYDAGKFQVFTAGSAIVSFIDANNAVLSYTVDGVTATKTIQRQVFP